MGSDVCSVCGEPIERTSRRPQYGPTPELPPPRGVGQRPWVHTNYRKTYDHQPGGTMDPNETLAKIREVATRFLDEEPWDSSTDASEAGLELANNIAALDEWLANGGFLPLAWENFRGAKTGGQPTR